MEITSHQSIAIHCASTTGLWSWLSGKESACWYKRLWRGRFNPWVRKIPWRRTWQLNPVFLPGESQGERSLAGYTVHGVGSKESDTTECLTNIHCTVWWTRHAALHIHAKTKAIFTILPRFHRQFGGTYLLLITKRIPKIRLGASHTILYWLKWACKGTLKNWKLVPRCVLWDICLKMRISDFKHFTLLMVVPHAYVCVEIHTYQYQIFTTS